MENKQAPRIKKYIEPENICYHCTSLRKLLIEMNDIQLLHSLEYSFRQQNLMKTPDKIVCYRCGDASLWIKEQEVETIWKLLLLVLCISKSLGTWLSSYCKRSFCWKDDIDMWPATKTAEDIFPGKRTTFDFFSDDD